MSIFIDSGKIKALALDLDGTVLAPEAKLTERTIRAVKKCIQDGLKIIIATGRSIEGAEPFRIPLGAEGPMIYFNGAVVSDMPKKINLKTTWMNKAAVELCVDLSRKTGVYCQIYFLNSEGRVILMAENNMPEMNMYYKHTGIQAVLGDLKEALRDPEMGGCVKIMFLAEPEILSALRPSLEDQLGAGVYITQTHRNFLEVMDARASKGQGLKFAMEYLSLKKEEVIAFGDEENDLPMSGIAGFFIAPLNAREAVKVKADIVIGNNAEDGAAAFLEEFFGLGR